ncbi:MAG: flavodoxin family protein [Lachnospiraceae bacterium]
MKTLILYYSYTGSSRKLAQSISTEINADLAEVETVKNPGTVNAYVVGSLAAMRHKITDIKPINVTFDEYDKIILIAPIWAGSPAPAFNSALKRLPKEKSLELYFVSASGKSNKDKISSFLSNNGYSIAGYHDIKTSTIS